MLLQIATKTEAENVYGEKQDLGLLTAKSIKEC